MNRSPERRAANEATFRGANEQIEDRAEELDLGASPIPFICECEEERCTALVRLTLGEYEEVRGRPKQFVVATGHDTAPDRVVAERKRFTVVEKTGVEGRLVAEDDPRS